MKSAANKLVVIDPERQVENKLKNPEHFVFRIEVEARDKGRDAFLVLKASKLNKCAHTLVEKSLTTGNLRVVFVRMDTNADLFFDKVQELQTPELLLKLFRTTRDEQINRILHAWCEKRQDNCIANAYVEEDDLVVQSCNLQHYRVRFDDFVGLRQLHKKQRHHFKIDEMGNQIFWPQQKVSIDLDVIRYKVDDEFRNKKNMDALADYQDLLGQGIKSVMRKHKLTQARLRELGGPTERHLYRIERGEQELNSKMIDRLAMAHSLSSKEYVEELIAACDDIAEQEASLAD
jgi:hypothetical protein